MLVLARKRKEWIDIGDDISICVVKLERNLVKIGIEAPSNIRIVRRELNERGQRSDFEKDQM